MKNIILIFALFAAQFGIAQTVTTTANKTNPEKIIYSDGNSNNYIITTDSIDYIPVKTQESSSGNYNGGVRKKIYISPSTFTQILKEVENLYANISIQTKTREKTSGALTAITNNKRNPVIIKQSPEQEKFEKLLNDLIK